MKAREKPRQRVTFAPSPARIPERIGTIGSTQGVSDRPNPLTKKKSRTAERLPSRSTETIRSWADSNAPEPLPPEEAMPADVPAPAAELPEDAAPAEGSTTLIVLVMGG